MPLGARHRLAFAALLLVACGGTTIDSHDYPRSCTSDADCALVYSGDLCAYCQCPDAAVASSALPKYQADAASRKNGCPKNTPPVASIPEFPQSTRNRFSLTKVYTFRTVYAGCVHVDARPR